MVRGFAIGLGSCVGWLLALADGVVSSDPVKSATVPEEAGGLSFILPRGRDRLYTEVRDFDDVGSAMAGTKYAARNGMLRGQGSAGVYSAIPFIASFRLSTEARLTLIVLRTGRLPWKRKKYL